jgi:beta-glucosidase
MTTTTELIQRLCGSLTLEEKVALLTGRDFWNTIAIERIGLRSMLCSDGPSGVRGERWDEREPSLNLPSSTALASSWSRELASRYGDALGAEARRKGVDIVLGPTINLHRSPYGGRHFECMSEDPLLTGEIAAAYVDGLQARGVAACAKHYVSNDFETDRFTVDVVVEERPLRELYLRPFEHTVVNAGAWTVMSGYNSINGATATENDLLETPLRTEWGFDGVVISDWTAVRSLRSATKEQDLAMPGPDGPWGSALVDAVRAGDIDEAAIDRKVSRLLLLAARVGKLSLEGLPARPDPDGSEAGSEAGDSVARSVAIAGSVLLRNDGILPFDPSTLGSVALIGDNARHARTQGGGSATVLPKQVSSPLDALAHALGDKLRYAAGAVVQEGVAELPLATLTNPETGEPGLRAMFLDADGTVIFSEDRRATALVYFGGDAPIAAAASLTLHTHYRAEADGTIRLGFAGIHPTTIVVDGAELLRDHLIPVGTDLGAAFLAPPSVAAPVEVQAGQVLDVLITLDLTGPAGPLANALSFTFGLEPDTSDPDGLIDDAAALAATSDVAIVVVGTNSRVESEGYDRTSLALPGRQDDLVRAVAAANPNTIVVVNAGAPVLLPWRDDVAAVLLTYFPGQEFGNALLAMLVGEHEPGGRLPTTWPADESHIPVTDVTPTDGKVLYTEGIHVGYRAWLRSGDPWAYPFGFGLGYTTWSIDSATAPAAIAAGEDVSVTVRVTNTGARPGKQVVQVYAERPDSAVERPIRWLVGFESVELGAGASADVTVEVRGREFAHWDDGWTWEPGNFTILAGTSVDNAPVRLELSVK